MNIKEKMKYVFIAFSSFISMILILGSTYVIEPGSVWFTKSFWKINYEIKEPGLYFKIPIITDVVEMNTRNIVVSTQETASSKDIQEIIAEVSVNFSIPSDKVIKLYEKIGKERDIVNNIIEKSIKETIKASTAHFTATETVTKRLELSNLVRETLEKKLLQNDLIVNSVEILNLSFSNEFNKSIEEKVKAEQDALKEKANKEKAQYIADQELIKAKAEAEKIKIQAEAITNKGWKEYVQLQWIEAWKAGGSKVPQFISWNNSSQFILDMKDLNTDSK